MRVFVLPGSMREVLCSYVHAVDTFVQNKEVRSLVSVIITALLGCSDVDTHLEPMPIIGII